MRRKETSVAEAWVWKSGEQVLAAGTVGLLISHGAGAEGAASPARSRRAASAPPWVWAEKAASRQSWLTQTQPCVSITILLGCWFLLRLVWLQCSRASPPLEPSTYLAVHQCFLCKESNEAVRLCHLSCLLEASSCSTNSHNLECYEWNQDSSLSVLPRKIKLTFSEAHKTLEITEYRWDGKVFTASPTTWCNWWKTWHH